MSTKCKSIICSIFAVIILAVLVFTMWYIFQPKTLIDTDTLRVICDGTKTTVYDLIDEKEYNFKTIRVKRSDGVSEPYSAIFTDTISIDIMPHGKLKITDKTAEKVYTIQRKFSS